MERYTRYHASCGCNNARGQRKAEVKYDTNNLHLAMPIMPIQEFRELYSPCEALEKGTLYKELYKPYCVRGGYRC